MSINNIREYYRNVEKAIKHGSTDKEASIRRYFANLLSEYARKNKLELIDELSLKLEQGNKRPDGTLKDSLSLDRGYWESKDSKDDLEKEIDKKFSIGYPKTNIIFEDSQRCILIQNGERIMEINIRDEEKLDMLLSTFVFFEPAYIKDFSLALEKFKEDIPKISSTLNDFIDRELKSNIRFQTELDRFLESCKHTINPYINVNDIREMIIQHILTEDIFNAVFGEKDFHRENNIAKNLDIIIDTFMTRATRKEYLSRIEHYYKTLNTCASNVSDHNEKQKFLKLVYENFYKAYNPKGADKLGVVYTPNEIVRFMVQSTDYLLEKFFGKGIHDKNIQILDPATGTATFITDIIDYIPSQYLEHKYKNEIHCNEISILPYYIANLNIEYTYYQKMNKYLEYENICFVDTLDNISGLSFKGRNHTLFDISDENAERIKKQNEQEISVIIGNPPYNANQLNFNDFNPNKVYTEIDKRIKDTFVKESTAQKTKVYDMYSRFYRWAIDRMKTKGIVSFITNRSFIDSKTFDGFRKCIVKDFDEVFIIDLQSDVRKNPKIAGTTHNVFGIQTGVAIMFLVKKEKKKEFIKIRYFSLTDEMLRKEKLDWLESIKFENIAFDVIEPDKQGNWLNITDNDFEKLIPLCSKETKLLKNTTTDKLKENTIFKLYSNGVVTARDEWVYDFDRNNLEKKMEYFSKIYNESVKNEKINENIKWSRDLRNELNKKRISNYDRSLIKENLFRPFVKKYYYSEKILSDILTQNHYDIFGRELNFENKAIAFNGANDVSWYCLASNKIIDLNSFYGGGQILPLYTYDEKGNRSYNITDWALEQFRQEYNDNNITKEDIFYYVYGVLNTPSFIKKYEQDLRRNLPRVAFFQRF